MIVLLQVVWVECQKVRVCLAGRTLGFGMQRHWQTDWAVRVFAGFVQTDLDSVIVGLVDRTAKAEMSAELVDQTAMVDLLAVLVG